jgi:putative membrane protein
MGRAVEVEQVDPHPDLAGDGGQHVRDEAPGRSHRLQLGPGAQLDHETILPGAPGWTPAWSSSIATCSRPVHLRSSAATCASPSSAVASSIARRADVKGFILSILAGALAFLVLLQVLPASMIDIKGSLWPDQLIVAVIVGAVNAVIKPIVKILSFPISLMTLGLSGFVINAGLLMGIAYAVQAYAELELTIGGWPTGGLTADTIVGAVVASVLLALLSAVIGLVVRD